MLELYFFSSPLIPPSMLCQVACPQLFCAAFTSATMPKKSTATHSSSKISKKRNQASTIHRTTTEQTTNDSHLKKSEKPHTKESFVNNTHTPIDFTDNHQTLYEEEELLCQVSEQDSQSQRGYDSTQDIQYAPQLQRWAYDVSDSSLPFTEKLEKSKWKAEKS